MVFLNIRHGVAAVAARRTRVDPFDGSIMVSENRMILVFRANLSVIDKCRVEVWNNAHYL